MKLRQSSQQGQIQVAESVLPKYNFFKLHACWKQLDQGKKVLTKSNLPNLNL